MNEPLVSIIIPVYNQQRFITATLESIYNQTYKNFECIIIDDGSTDESNILIRKFCLKDNRFKFYKRPLNRLSGGNASRNYGFEISKGDLINWFDADDLMTQDFLEFKVKNLKYNHNFIITSGKYIDENENTIGDFKFNNDYYLYKRYAMYKFVIITGNILFRKDYLIKQSLFNENLKRLQENELFTRLFFKVGENEYTCKNHKSLLYRQHNNSITEKDKIYNHEFKKSLSFNYVSNFERSYLLKDRDIINYYYRLLIYLFFESKLYSDSSNTSYILNNIRNCYNKFSFKIIFINLMLLITKNSKTGHYKIKKFLLKQKL